MKGGALIIDWCNSFKKLDDFCTMAATKPSSTSTKASAQHQQCHLLLQLLS
jgi:hypothetical protein